MSTNAKIMLAVAVLALIIGVFAWIGLKDKLAASEEALPTVVPGAE